MSNKIDSYIMKTSVTAEDFNSINDIDVTDIYLNWKNKNNWKFFNEKTNPHFINWDDKWEDTVLIKCVIDCTVEVCNNYFTNIAYLKITNLPKGKYNLSFLRTNGYANGYDVTDSVKTKKHYDKQYCWFNLYKYRSSQDSQFDEAITKSSLAYTNDIVTNIKELKLCNTNTTDNLLYNISTPFYLSKYDMQYFIEYFVNINNDESVYQYMKNFSDNFRTSIQFTSSDESDTFILLFYYSYNDIQLTGQKQFDNYNIYLSNFKLEYNINNIKDSN